MKEFFEFLLVIILIIFVEVGASIVIGNVAYIVGLFIIFIIDFLKGER